MGQRVTSENDVNLWYGQIWHRKARADEVRRHAHLWRTPFSRLINWLVDETPDRLIGWQWPLQSRRITARFMDPAYEQYWGRKHYGLDVGSPRGSKLLPLGQGVCEKTGFDDGVKWDSRAPLGNFVQIRHNKKYRSRYGHMERIDVVPGWFIPASFQIGTVDNTGWSNGDHVHFELEERQWWGGWKKIDPLTKIPNG